MLLSTAQETEDGESVASTADINRNYHKRTRNRLEEQSLIMNGVIAKRSRGSQDVTVCESRRLDMRSGDSIRSIDNIPVASMTNAQIAKLLSVTKEAAIALQEGKFKSSLYW